MTKKINIELTTAEVIGLWAAIQHHDFGLVDVGWDHQRLRDEFAKLISRPDIGDGDRLWLRWLAENDSEWLVATDGFVHHDVQETDV